MASVREFVFRPREKRREDVVFHVKELQYQAMPERPDPVFAKKLQEILGGVFGEMTVMMAYLFQGWNCRGPEKYRDMLLDIGTEEIAHVEMLSVMISRLLEGAPLQMQEEVVAGSPTVAATMGGTEMRDAMAAGMNPQHAIVSGLGGHAEGQRRLPLERQLHRRQRQPAGRFPLEPDGRIAGQLSGQPAVCDDR